MVWDEIIEGNFIRMRAAQIEDAQFTYDIRQDKEKTKYLHPVHGTVEDQKDWLIRQREREGDYFFVVEDKKKVPIGTIALCNIQGEEGEPGRLVIYGDSAQNMEANLLLTDFAFFTCGLSKLHYTVLEKNQNVNSFTKKLGGTEEFREFDKELNATVIHYSITKERYMKKSERVRKSLAILADSLLT